MKIILVIPTYNEKGNIERLIDVLEKKVFPGVSGHKMGILVVDDSSPDGTGEVVKSLMKKWPNISLQSGKKQGLGAAYLRGMAYAIKNMKADVVFEMDADLSHDPYKIGKFIEKIDKGFDLVVGTRYSRGGSIPDTWGLHRKIFSVSGNFLVRFILGQFFIHDWTGGYRAIRKEVFLKEESELKPFRGYTFQVAFLYKAIKNGFKVAEVPIHFIDRSVGKSKIASISYIFNLLSYVISSRIKELAAGTFGKFLVVGGTGFLINALIYALLVNNSHMGLIWANTIGAELAIFSNYNLNNLWTFGKNKISGVGPYLGKMVIFFLTSNVGVWIFQNGTIKLGSIFYERKYYFIYFLIGTALLLVWNFTTYSLIIWRNKKHK